MNDSNQVGTLPSIVALARASWDSTVGERLRFFGFIILFVLAYSIDLAVPWAIGWLLDVFIKQGFTHEAFQHAQKFIWAYIALRMGTTIFHHLARYLQTTCSFASRFNKLTEIFSAIIRFPLKWHVHHHSGENLSRLNRSVGAIESVIGNYAWQIVDGVVKFFFATFALFTLDLEVAVTVLVMGFVTLSVMFLFNKRLVKRWRRNNRYNDRLNRTNIDYLSNIITVKTLRLEDPALTYLTKQRDEGFLLSRKIGKYQELKWGTIGVGYSLVMGSSLFIYFYNHVGVTGDFNVAPVYVLMNYLDKIFGAIQSFTGYYSGIIEAALAYEDGASVLSESKRTFAPPHRSALPRTWNSVELSGVEFSYGTDTKNLRDISLSIRRGEKIALVGPSGGGKSTLLKVLSGMLAAHYRGVTASQQGTFSLDDIADVSILVPQEPEVFSESVRYNLNFDQGFSDDQLLKAMRICRIDHLLEKLPNGWDSTLEEAGLNISGGERQRLALARGVLRVPGKDILLLDEPTSSLDPLTEKQIFANILTEFKDLTIITACHRLALVPMFDTVVYVRDGRVEEVGSFSDLRAAGKGFSAAWADYERTVMSGE